MRQTKYRGLALETKRWAYGYYCQIEDRHFIIPLDANTKGTDTEFLESFVEVDPETVGEFTGLKDKNGKEAWQSDKIKIKDGDGIAIGNVLWHKEEGQWYWQCCEIDRSCLTMFIGRGIPLHKILDEQNRFKGKVIGNIHIHENPELLEPK